MGRDYRAYAISAEDRIVHRIDLLCADDDEARHRARQLVDEYAIELWRDQILLARYELPH
jgi:hypothetical protein